MIKLLYTVNGLRVNGMSAVIMKYVSLLDKNQYKITLFTDEIAPQFSVLLEENNVEVINSQNRKKNQIAYFFELVNVIKSGKFDIIHAHGNSATLAVEMFAAKCCGVPVRISHSHNTTCQHKTFDKLLRPLFNNTYTHGIACGDEAGKWLFGSREHVVIKNGIDLEHFAYDEGERDRIRKNLNIEEKFVIGHVGRFTDQKNHDFLIDIFQGIAAERSDAVLFLIGDGPREQEVKELVKQRGLEDRVIFYGTLSDVAKMYSVFDIFAFPSKFEGVPLTLIEAQASGIKCIVSDRVSEEVMLTDLITMLSLDDKEIWLEHVVQITTERNESSQKVIIDLGKSGFGNNSVIESLEQVYKGAISVCGTRK